MMNAITKAFIGVLIVIASLYYILLGIPGYLKPALSDVLVVLNGVIPILALLLGAFIIWLEYDEWKIEQELKKEEQKEKRKRKNKTFYLPFSIF